MSPYSGNLSSSRPGTRRRESSDFIQNNQLASPTGNTRFSRDEPHISSPPPSLLRRRTDFKDNSAGTGLGDKDEDNEKSGLSPDSALPFGILKRTVTGPASAGTGSSSPWSGGPQSAGFAPMGAFGNFSLGGASAQPFTPNEKKSAFGSTRGESRFKGLMNFDNSEENKLKVKEKASLNSLEQLAEASNEQPPLSWNTSREQRRDSRAYQDEEKFGAGSAALGGDDASSPRTHSSRTRNPDPQMSFDDIGFASLGLSDDVPPFRDMVQRRDQSQNTPQGRSQGTSQLNEPMSPTNTNPYQSPEGEKAIPEEIDLDDLNPPSHFIGARNFGHPGRGIHAQHDGASDRSQTSSAGASRAFPTLGPLGALGGIGPAGAWPNPPGAIGTPTRATPGYSSPFGDSIFSPSADIGLPNYNTTGTGSGFAGGTAGSAGPIGRGSKMGSLFPNAMQEQMREPLRQEQGSGDSMDIYQKNAAAAAANAPGFAAGLRETDSPIRSGRNPLDDLFANLDSRNRNAYPGPFSGSEPGPVASTQAQTSGPSQPTYSAAATFAGTPSLATSNSGSYFSRNQDQEPAASLASQLPASQQRQMVMPDRMRWIYRDPQGTTQGPWSGLEMHDWYKGGFFSPELQVKRVEDTEYEPLAQLIRRIGNSREPFLVPQIGIAHGSSVALPSSNASAAGAISTTTPAALQASAAQPPFASSFPSFGTTLTAEQQNALERRKQEEQYLMARQKEHLAQQQVMIKQMQQMQGVTHGLHNQQLHHHSSAHSLQSQPSYGSITSPTVYQPPSVGQGPKQPPAVPPFFDLIPRNSVPVPSLDPLGSGTLSSLREDDVAGIMDRLNRGVQQSTGAPAYIGGPQENLNHSQHIAAVMQERNRLQREQEHYDMLQRNSDDHRGTADRLEQYHLLRAMDEAPLYPQHGPIGGHVGPQSSDFEHSSSPQQGQDTSAEFRDLAQAIPTSIKAAEQLSLSEQVQKAAMAKQSPITQAQSPWAKVEGGLPLHFPPPQSSSPLPAPAAQRKGQNVADTLTAESHSRSQTPLAETPSSALAPWAKDNMDSLKGPSLKEIQAMEAKKAAQQEEIAAAARRALAEQERHNQAAQPMAPAPGLPLSANWASGTSPATSTASGAPAWTKPGAGKIPLATVSTSTKKTLAQIQKEEEVRKNRAAAAAAAASTASAAALAAAVITPGGKRYADLASKAALSIPQNQSTAWTTVGAGGKVKTPIASTPVLTKPTASVPAQPTTAPPTKPKVTVPARNAGGGAASNHQAALDEFQKWTKNALGKGLNTGIPSENPFPTSFYDLSQPQPSGHHFSFFQP